MNKLIERNIFKFGILPILLLVEVLEKEQRYELCQSVLNSLQKHCKKYDIDCPKRYSVEAIVEMKIDMMSKFNMSGDIIEGNLPAYAAEVLVEINKAFPLIESQAIKTRSDFKNDFDFALYNCLIVKPVIYKFN